jgi:glycosyltransferase involved in cell wall biosynthesis
MAGELALVSCLPGELAEVIRNEGIGMQYAAGSADSLVKCLRELLNNSEQRHEMQRKARELFEANYKSDRIYGQLTHFLEAITAGVTYQGSV